MTGPLPRRRWWAVGVLGPLSLAWLVYQLTKTRRPHGRMPAETSCGTDPNAVADMSQFTPGAAPIRCQPWDIGTGVTGYVWHAPNARAVLLLQHGYAEHAPRFVKQYKGLIPHLLNMGVSVYGFDM